MQCVIYKINLVQKYFDKIVKKQNLKMTSKNFYDEKWTHPPDQQNKEK